MHHAPAKLLTFTIDRERFGIEIEQVDEIIRAVRLARLPKAPQVLEGLIDLRGAVVPVLDIRARFRLPAKPIGPSDHIVIARARERVVGLRVDRATDVLAVPRHAIEDIAEVVAASDYVTGVAKLPDGLLFIHDLATFLSQAEACTLDDAVREGLPA